MPIEAKHLQGFPLFAGASPAAVELVASRCELRKYLADEVILHTGDVAEHIYLLISGAARVVLRGSEGVEVTAKLFAAPALFGEMETLSFTTFIEDVEATAPATVALLDRSLIEALFAAHPITMRNLLTDVCARFRTTALNQLFMAAEPVERRVAAMLVAYLDAYGSPFEDGVAIPRAAVNQNTLAQGVGATLRSVQRVFMKWQRDGLVMKDGDRYVIYELETLREIASEAPRYYHRMRKDT